MKNGNNMNDLVYGGSLEELIARVVLRVTEFLDSGVDTMKPSIGGGQ